MIDDLTDEEDFREICVSLGDRLEKEKQVITHLYLPLCVNVESLFLH